MNRHIYDRKIIDRIMDLFAYMSDEDFVNAFNDYAEKNGFGEIYVSSTDLEVFPSWMDGEDFANVLEKSNFRKDEPFFTVSEDYVFTSCYLDDIPGIDGFAEYVYSHYSEPIFHAIAEDVYEIVSKNEGWEDEEKELQSYWYNSRI